MLFWRHRDLQFPSQQEHDNHRGRRSGVRRREGPRRAEALRFHGISRLPDGTRDVDVAGGKFNMSDVSARLGLVQLTLLDAWNAHRQKLAARYIFPARFACR